ncbi:hypothetical protein FRB90_006228 [Tulasnella sp. 427]|nr:hypothetical protein FRB90_006228 [Tulasnella sp. 427]
MQSHQMQQQGQQLPTLTSIGLGLGIDGAGGYSYALKQQPTLLPMLGTSSVLTDPKLLGMGISPYLTPPHSSIELELAPSLTSPNLNSGSSHSPIISTATSPPPPQPLPTAPLQQQIAISTAFYPGSTLFGRELAAVQPDLVVQSGDGVFFYVHLSLIGSKSSNRFNGLVARGLESSSYIDTPLLTPDCSEPTPPASPRSASENAGGRPSSSSSSKSHSRSSPRLSNNNTTTNTLPDPSLPSLISIPEPSGVINILFHVLYNTTSFARYSPDFETLSAVLPFMRKYGFDVAEMLGSAATAGIASAEVVQTLLSFAPERPLQVYALAGQYGLRELAVAASPYTLDVSLSNVTDELSVAMGPLYLKWLFFLHFGRSEALKRILVKPFEHHLLGLAGATCTEDDRSAMGRAWGLVTAYILSLPNTQNVSVGSLSTTYGGLVGSVKCARCKEQLGRRIDEVVRGWGGVQTTI